MTDRIERVRLQVMIPAATFQALDQAAQTAGVSRAETVDHLLTAGLNKTGHLTKALWKEPSKLPVRKQQTFSVPLPLVTWLQIEPDTMSAATRVALGLGIYLEREGYMMYPPPIGGDWNIHQRVNVRLDPDMWSIIDTRRQQQNRTWTKTAVTYLYMAYLECQGAIPRQSPITIKTLVPKPLVDWLTNQAVADGIPRALQAGQVLRKVPQVTLYRLPPGAKWKRVQRIEIVTEQSTHTNIQNQAESRRQHQGYEQWTEREEIQLLLYSVYYAENPPAQ